MLLEALVLDCYASGSDDSGVDRKWIGKIASCSLASISSWRICVPESLARGVKRMVSRGGPPPKTEWFSPQVLFGIVGILSMLLSTYLTFQRDTGSQIAALTSRVAVLEVKIDDVRARIK